LGAAGSTTPARRVHGRSSIHEACELSGSTLRKKVRVAGAFHQLCSLTCRAGCSAISSPASEATEPLPPWPLTTTMRLKPCACRLQSRSRITARKVDRRSDTVPG
jgi:hypothetical protein